MAPIVKDFPKKIITELKIKCALLVFNFYMKEKKLPSLKTEVALRIIDMAKSCLSSFLVSVDLIVFSEKI